MYRIELAPGEITVFRTIEELATGVRNGVITPRARIFHNASQKWLPIEFHPHHKLALELLAGRTIDLPTQKSTDGPKFDNIVTPMVSSTPSAPATNLPYIVLDEPLEAEAPAAPLAPVQVAPPQAAPGPVAPIQATPFQPSQVQAAPVHPAPVQATPVLAPWARVAPSSRSAGSRGADSDCAD